MTRTVVVGAGLSGLSAAWALSRGHADVVVLEASPRAGGVVRSETRNGYLLELGPNTVRPSAELWRLVEELGLAGDALLADPRAPRYVDYGGRLHELPSGPAALLGSKLLSASGKLRLLSEPFRRSAGPPDESVRDFVRRRLGQEAADRIVEPFVAGIFAGSAARLEAASAFPRLVAWERAKGSIVRGAIASRREAAESRAPRGLLSFRGGLETLPRTLARSLGAAFQPGREALSLEPRAGGRWTVTTAAGPLETGRVLLASRGSRRRPLTRSRRSRILLWQSCICRGPRPRWSGRCAASATSSSRRPIAASSAPSGARASFPAVHPRDARS
jgi:protoporphyrinogen/coproporphyrinogen III oxidase